MNPPLPKAVLLDLDDTILDDSGGIEHCWKEACFRYAHDLHGIDPFPLYEEIQRTREWFWADPDRHRRGRLDLEAAARDIVARSLDELGASNSALAAKIAKSYRFERDSRLEPFPDAIDTVRWLRESGCRLGLVTNGNAATQRGKVTRFRLTELFDAILIEGELGIGKPDPRVYTRAISELGVTAAQAWMVGDNLEWDVAQPQRMGMVGVWVDVSGAGLPAKNAIRPDRIVRGISELRLGI